MIPSARHAIVHVLWLGLTASVLPSACGDASDPGPDATLPAGLQALPAATDAEIAAATLAVGADDRAWTLLVRDAELMVIDHASGLQVRAAQLPAPVTALTVAGGAALLVTAPAGETVQLWRFELDDAFARPPTETAANFAQVVDAVAWIDAERALVVGSAVANAHVAVHVAVVDLATGAVTPTAMQPRTFSYDPPSIGRDGLRFLVPSAYPGEIVTVEPEAGVTLREERVEIENDWLHDVTWLGDGRALIAGHLTGLQEVRLDDQGQVVELRRLDDGLRTYVDVRGDRLYGVAEPGQNNNGAPTRLLCGDVDAVSLTSQDLPGSTNWAPRVTHFVDEAAPGVARLFVKGVGVIEVACAPAGRKRVLATAGAPLGT